MAGRFSGKLGRAPDDASFGPRARGTARTSADGLAEPTIVSHSDAMSETLEFAAIYARLDVPILLEGESGTGKLYVARYIHFESSRREAPFRWVHGATLDDGLAASDLYGHAQGAFTGASRLREGLLSSANGGTVFLDELAKMKLSVQGKLLHVIEGHPFHALGEDRARSVDVRFVTAASEQLEPLAASGLFLHDLLQRVKGFRIWVPPLRDRRADIPELVVQFAELLAPKAGYFSGPPQFDPVLVAAMTRAPWERNLRGLHDTVLKLMVFAQGAQKVSLAHCRADLGYLVDLARRSARPSRRDVEVAFERAGSNKTKAAEMLGVSRKTVQRRMKGPPSDEKRDGGGSTPRE